MNISSYNITDISYHYIGLRVLAGMQKNFKRSYQIEAISRNVFKFVNDKALRLMLPEPKGTFSSIGEKICQELVHFQFARSGRTNYELTQIGEKVLHLLATKQYIDLRRLMALVHLKTYDNLRAVIQTHLKTGPVWRPVVEATRIVEKDYFQRLLEPTFRQDATSEVVSVFARHLEQSPKRIESVLHDRILQRVMPNQNMKVALFRAICDRLVSLRLLNIRRTTLHQCEFIKTYSPCTTDPPLRPWYVPLQIPLANDEVYTIYLCEPDMADTSHQDLLLEAIDKGFSKLSPEGGYYDISELRNLVCEQLMIPEAAFDDGINHLLDRQPSVLTVGLQYERITGHRKPLVRNGQNVQLHNLIRRL